MLKGLAWLLTLFALLAAVLAWSAWTRYQDFVANADIAGALLLDHEGEVHLVTRDAVTLTRQESFAPRHTSRSALFMFAIPAQ